MKIAKKPKIKRSVLLLITLIFAFTSVGGYLYSRPITNLNAEIALPQYQPEPVEIHWPDSLQAAFSVTDHSVRYGTENQTPVPTASVAKVMTALMVLKKHPLNLGESGPTLTLSNKDVQHYHDAISNNGSSVAVVTGEQLSEYQALEAMLLPSANNMATTLAEWAYGSIEGYLIEANKYAQELGMTSTVFKDDASGLSPQTKSTAKDLVILGEAALKSPVLKEITSQSSAVIPVAGEIKNTNLLLGSEDITGIKTGSSNEAGGCYLFAANHTFDNDQTITVVGAILGADNKPAAFNATPALLNTIYSGFADITIVNKDQIMGQLTSPWGEQVDIATQKELKTFGWKGNKLDLVAKIDTDKAPVVQNQQIGKLIISNTNTSVPLVAKKSLNMPSLWWRVTDLKH